MIKDSIPDHFRHSTLLKTPLGLAPNLIIKHPKTEVRSKKGKIYGLWWFLDPNTARPELRPEQIIKRQVMWEFKVIQCQSHPALTTEDLLGPGDQAVYELSANCRATSASRAIEVKFIFTGRAIAPCIIHVEKGNGPVVVTNEEWWVKTNFSVSLHTALQTTCPLRATQLTEGNGEWVEKGSKGWNRISMQTWSLVDWANMGGSG